MVNMQHFGKTIYLFVVMVWLMVPTTKVGFGLVPWEIQIVLLLEPTILM